MWQNIFPSIFYENIPHNLNFKIFYKLTYTYEVCPESIKPCTMKETFIEKDTRYKKHCTQDNDTAVPFKVGTLGPHTVLPIAISCFIVFS